MNESERLQILEMIEKGVISAAEGVRLLNSLQGDTDEAATPSKSESLNTTSKGSMAFSAPKVVPEPPPPESSAPSAQSGFDSGVRKWRRFWWVPLSIGIVITVLSGLFMFLAYQKSGFGFWFACLWFPLLLGVVVISLAVTSRTTRWLHVRVQQKHGEWPKTIAISLPIPIRFVAWILRIFRPHIHAMDKTNLDEVILALDKTSPDQPFYVKVDEDESGEKVEVYIG